MDWRLLKKLKKKLIRDEFRKTGIVTQGERTTIYLVSSSDSISDINKAKEYQDQIKDYFFKPMTLEDLQKIF